MLNLSMNMRNKLMLKSSTLDSYFNKILSSLTPLNNYCFKYPSVSYHLFVMTDGNSYILLVYFHLLMRKTAKIDVRIKLTKTNFSTSWRRKIIPAFFSVLNSSSRIFLVAKYDNYMLGNESCL